MTTLLEWAKSIFLLFKTPVALTPNHGWLLSKADDVRAARAVVDGRPLADVRAD